MTIKRKYNSLDITKLIMATVVIGIHTKPFINCSSELVQNVWAMVSGCAVPFFFLATGYLLAVKFKEPWGAPDNTAVIVAYISKVVKLYTVWSAIYLPLAIADYVKEKRTLLYSIFHYFRGFFLVGEHHNSWMLWYLLSTIYALLFVLVFIRLRLPFRAVLLGGALIMVVSIALDSLVAWEGYKPTVLYGLKMLIQLTIANGRILQGAFYIPWGMVLARKKLPLWANCTIFLLAFTGGGITDRAEARAGLIAVCSIALFGIVEQIKLKDSAAFPVMRKMSTVLYFTHLYVWTFYYIVVYGETTYGPDCFFAVTGICITIALLYTAIKGNTKQKNVNLQKTVGLSNILDRLLQEVCGGIGILLRISPEIA